LQLIVDNNLGLNLCVVPTTCYIVIILDIVRVEREQE